jgi:hypothetical protein
MNRRAVGILLVSVAAVALVYAVTSRPISRVAFGVASVCVLLALYLFLS